MRALGLLAGAQRRFHQARTQLTEALVRCQSMPASAWELQVEIDLLRLDVRAETVTADASERTEQLAERARLAGWHGFDWELRRLALNQAPRSRD